ncbi:MAG: hypothetical protein GY929_02765 [Actinomycetia bacterium]|nr:hypothetical protein [Actinomycetes bacterium]
MRRALPTVLVLVLMVGSLPSAAADQHTDQDLCDLTPTDGFWSQGAATVDGDLSVRGITSFDASVPTAMAACSNGTDLYINDVAWVGPLAVGVYLLSSPEEAAAEGQRILSEATAVAPFVGPLDQAQQAHFSQPVGRIVFEFDEVWITTVGPYLVFGHSERDGHDGDQVNAANAALAERMGTIITNIGGTSGAGSGGQTTTTIAPSVEQPLCAEALALLEGFSQDDLARAGITDTSKTDIAVDDAFLLADFQLAITRHNEANPDDTAYSNESFGVGGVADVLWFASDPYVGPASAAQAYVTGQEGALRDRIVALSDRRRNGGSAEPRLTPGEVFEIALDLSRGDANQALLTAHNAIRTFARGTEADMAQAMGIPADRNDAFFEQNLVPVRSADNSGSWYHLYGTAYMEMASRGDWLPWTASAGTLVLASAGGPAAWLLAAATVGATAASKVDSDASGTSGAARIFNGLEQLARENITDSTPDPVEFCFNVWGGQLGRNLYLNLPNRFTRPLFDPPYEGFRPPDTGLPNFDAVRNAAESRFLTIVHSPFAIELDDGSNRLVFDQIGPGLDQQRLQGYVDGFAVPFQEDDSWGFIYAQPGDLAIDATFVAVEANATMHLTRTDMTTGETYYWTTTAATMGDRLNVSISTAAAPELTGPGGVVTPEVFTIDLGDFSGPTQPNGPGDSSGRNWSPYVLAILVVGAVGIFLVWRRHSQAAVVLATTPPAAQPPDAVPPAPQQPPTVQPTSQSQVDSAESTPGWWDQDRSSRSAPPSAPPAQPPGESGGEGDSQWWNDDC